MFNILGKYFLFANVLHRGGASSFTVAFCDIGAMDKRMM
jgi:hypothetical protein